MAQRWDIYRKKTRQLLADRVLGASFVSSQWKRRRLNQYHNNNSSNNINNSSHKNTFHGTNNGTIYYSLANNDTSSSVGAGDNSRSLRDDEEPEEEEEYMEGGGYEYQQYEQSDWVEGLDMEDGEDDEFRQHHHSYYYYHPQQAEVAAADDDREEEGDIDDGIVMWVCNSGERYFMFLCSLLWPMIDSYWLAAIALLSTLPDRTVAESVLIQRAQWFADHLHKVTPMD